MSDGGLLVCGGEGGVGFAGGLVPGGVGVGGDDLFDLEVGVVEDEGFFRAVGGVVDDCGEAVFGFVGVDGVVLEDAGFELFFPAEAGQDFLVEAVFVSDEGGDAVVVQLGGEMDASVFRAFAAIDDGVGQDPGGYGSDAAVGEVDLGHHRPFVVPGVAFGGAAAVFEGHEAVGGVGVG